MEGDSNIVTLKDENGEDFKFEFLDLVEYDGEEYLVLMDPDTPEDEAGMVDILKVVESENPEEETYESVDDSETLDAVFELFRAKNQNRFNFAD